jgi:hypothetical protein
MILYLLTRSHAANHASFFIFFPAGGGDRRSQKEISAHDLPSTGAISSLGSDLVSL